MALCGVGYVLFVSYENLNLMKVKDSDVCRIAPNVYAAGPAPFHCLYAFFALTS